MFKKLEIKDWKHFEKIELDFHPRLTILTGANGSGKSTLLRILARHVNWNFNELGTPEKDEKTGLLKYWARKLFSPWFNGVKKTETELGNSVGDLEYSSGQKSAIHVSPSHDNAAYGVSMPHQQGMRGVHIPAYRPQFIHQAVVNISTSPRTREQAFQSATQACRNSFQGGQNSSGHLLKETLLNWVQHGYGSQISPGNQIYKDLFHNFEEKIRTVLPKNIGFKKFEPRNAEIVLICESGEYLLDASSGGITALIDLTWQIFLADDGTDFLVVIDEIENHLHPSMQRSVLSDFARAFPKAVFIVTTHSPFVVGSVADSAVYALRFNGKNRVVSERLDLVDKAGTASDVLKDVLGVPVTVPIWVENKLKAVIEKYQALPLTADNIKALAAEIKQEGLENLSTVALTNYVASKANS